MTARLTCLAAVLVCVATSASAQETPSTDTRTQYPVFMKDSYFSLNIGSIGYLFSGTQLEPGFEAESIDKARIAVRADFFGHRFTKWLAAQVTYMRPGVFVKYNNVNGTGGAQAVSNAYAGLTFVLTAPLSPKLSLYGEGGYGVTSRSGFVVNGVVALKPAHYAAGIIGLGFTYQLTPNVDGVLGLTYSPGRRAFTQPSTRLYSLGFRYNMRALPEAVVIENRDAGYLFPENIVRVGLTTNGLGYGVNDVFSRWIVIFWGGHVETDAGVTIDYARNVFHSKKRFAFDLGASASYWRSNETHQTFRTLSAFPLVRYFFGRLDSADVYFSYSVAGPTLITESILDGLETGASFTFQDAMAVGAFLGKSRRLNAEIGIKHFSNGNLATSNAGIKIPLTFTLGVAF